MGHHARALSRPLPPFRRPGTKLARRCCQGGHSGGAEGKMNWRRRILTVWLVLFVTWSGYHAWAMNVPLALSSLWNHSPTREEFLAQSHAVETKNRATDRYCNPYLFIMAGEPVPPSCQSRSAVQPPDAPAMFRDNARIALWRFLFVGLGAPIVASPPVALGGLYLWLLGRWVWRAFNGAPPN